MKNIRSIGQKNNIIKSIYLILVSILTVFSFSTPIFAKVDNQLVQIEITESEILFKDFNYTNDTDKTVKYKIDIQAYDAKSETFLTTKPFITSQVKEFELKPKATKNIKYVVTIDNETPAGTYFNVISITPDSKTDTTNSVVGVKNALGILVVINVTDSNTPISKIYQKQNSTQLIIENPGFPFIYPMKIKYSYKNDSNYVFSPIGEIRILDDNQTQVTDRYEINPNEKTIYPQETINVEWEVDTWKDINQILKGKTVIARLYSGDEDIYIGDQIKVDILPQVGVLIAIAILILIFIISLIFSLLKTIYNKKRKTKEVIIKEEFKNQSTIEK